VTNWRVHSCPSPIAAVRLLGSDRGVSGLVTDCVDPTFLTQLRHFESMFWPTAAQNFCGGLSGLGGTGNGEG